MLGGSAPTEMQRVPRCLYNSRYPLHSGNISRGNNYTTPLVHSPTYHISMGACVRCVVCGVVCGVQTMRCVLVAFPFVLDEHNCSRGWFCKRRHGTQLDAPSAFSAVQYSIRARRLVGKRAQQTLQQNTP